MEFLRSPKRRTHYFPKQSCCYWNPVWLVILLDWPCSDCPATDNSRSSFLSTFAVRRYSHQRPGLLLLNRFNWYSEIINQGLPSDISKNSKFFWRTDKLRGHKFVLLNVFRGLFSNLVFLKSYIKLTSNGRFPL